MATDEQLTKIKETTTACLELHQKDLVQRQEWGTLNFEAATTDLDRSRTLFVYLDTLPIDLIPETAMRQIQTSADPVLPTLKEIDEFKITDNAVSKRDSLIQSLNKQVDAFYTHTASWIPFLAYKQGDVDANIKALNSAVLEGKSIHEKALEEAEEAKNEIDKIITQAREASAAAGAAVFTTDFEEQAKEQASTAKSWLKATVSLFIISLLFAGAAMVSSYWLPNGRTNAEIAQFLIAKVVFLGALLSSTIWCGKIYKAAKHQSSINRHRALSLRTLQAFSNAADDPATKDAVLIEATRAIFNAGSTGLVGSSPHDDGQIKILEIAKLLTPGKA